MRQGLVHGAVIPRALALALLMWAATAAHAHLMPANQGGVRIDNDTVMSVVSLPVSAFSGFDDDGDGRMTLAELNRHRPGLLRQAAARLQYRANGEQGTLLLEDLMIPHLHDPSAPPSTDQLIAVQRYKWAHPVSGLTLQARLAPGQPPLALQAVQEGRGEAVVLTAGTATHHFFEAAPLRLLRFVLLGAEHILLGLDHLLFLLTILAAGASWRYWLAVATSFTVAHSLTLAAAMAGWVSVPPSIAEPLIAASIVLVALDNLWRARVAARQRAAIVFACGLVHGLGFATALRELSGSGTPWAELLGFNLGVEAGQLLFVSAVLLAMAAVRRLWPRQGPRRMVQATSAAAALAGVWLLVQHI
ncbi:MAG: HupE/UreJ family protein [Burkholderiales bacterium]|nr:HupE/UreJ family protein [Burkholderiales bacterium]